MTYSLPSDLTNPFSLAEAIEPCSIKSLNETTSAFIKPLSISEWIFPAACGAFVAFLIVHALTSGYPAVRNDINPSKS